MLYYFWSIPVYRTFVLSSIWDFNQTFPFVFKIFLEIIWLLFKYLDEFFRIIWNKKKKEKLIKRNKKLRSTESCSLKNLKREGKEYANWCRFLRKRMIYLYVIMWKKIWRHRATLIIMENSNYIINNLKRITTSQIYMEY